MKLINRLIAIPSQRFTLIAVAAVSFAPLGSLPPRLWVTTTLLPMPTKPKTMMASTTNWWATPSAATASSEIVLTMSTSIVLVSTCSAFSMKIGIARAMRVGRTTEDEDMKRSGIATLSRRRRSMQGIGLR